jgi:hypothetical protein
VGEIFLEKTTNFITVASNLESGEPLWFGRERKKETLDEFFGTQLSARQRHRITQLCQTACSSRFAGLESLDGGLFVAGRTMLPCFLVSPDCG